MPISNPAAFNSHRDSTMPVPAASTARFAATVVAYATASERMSNGPNPTSTRRSTSTRHEAEDGDAQQSQRERGEERVVGHRGSQPAAVGPVVPDACPDKMVQPPDAVTQSPPEDADH